MVAFTIIRMRDQEVYDGLPMDGSQECLALLGSFCEIHSRPWAVKFALCNSCALIYSSLSVGGDDFVPKYVFQGAGFGT